MSQKEIEVILAPKGDETVSGVWNEKRKDLASTLDPTAAQGSLQRIQQYLVRRRQRELLEKTRRRLATEPSEPGETEIFGRCPQCGEALGRL
jgi:hypothetical protein